MNRKAERTNAPTADPVSEQMLVVAANNGDEQAFEILFTRHKHKVLAVVLRYAHVREDAEDIVQRSFQKAFVHLHKFEGRSSFSTWLTSIAVNEALIFLRRMGAMRELPIDGTSDAEGNAAALQIPDSRPNPEAGYLQRERERILVSAIGYLIPGERHAIELRGIDEFSTEETAQRMGVSVGAVKTRLFRAKRELRQRLTRHLKSNSKFGTSAARMGSTTTPNARQQQLCNASSL